MDSKEKTPTETDDKTFINPVVSAKYNIGRYGLIGHQVCNNAGKSLVVFNEPDQCRIEGATDYANWLGSVQWAKENYALIREGHEEKMNRIPADENQLQLFPLSC